MCTMENQAVVPPTAHSSDISVHTYTIAGIQTHIYGLDQLRPLLLASFPPPSLAVLWTLHPRLDTHTYMAPIIRQNLAKHYYYELSQTSTPPVGLLGVSFDQRNHGSREVSSVANLAFRSPAASGHPPNPSHAMDMLGIYAGTTADLGLLIDLLPGYLEFHYNPPPPPLPPPAIGVPTTETQGAYIPIPTITSNIALGISLGGHAAYLAALHLDKVTSAIPIIACADYPALISNRLKQSKLVPVVSASSSSNTPSAWMPSSFLNLLLNSQSRAQSPLLTSPHNTPLGALKGKKLLILSGGADKLVPPEHSRGFIESLRREIDQGELKGTKAAVREVVYDGVGHEFTLEMAEEVRRFVRDRVVEAREAWIL